MNTLQAEATYIYIHNVLLSLNIKQRSKYCLAKCLKDLDRLDKYDDRIAHTVLNYNRPSRFYFALVEKHGENEIVDHRYKDYYKFTRYHLKKAYSNKFNEMVDKYTTVDRKWVIQHAAKALRQARKETIEFNRAKNKGCDTTKQEQYLLDEINRVESHLATA